MTMLTHPLSEPFSNRLQRADFELLRHSNPAAELLALSYCGTAL
jgi:hypothetical protein